MHKHMADTFLTTIRSTPNRMIAMGIHPGIIQSILDFDAMLGKHEPSIAAIVSGNRSAVKFFFGTKEILLPCYQSMSAVPESLIAGTSWMLNLLSGRRAHEGTVAFFERIPNALGGHIFAENVPEAHALDLSTRYRGKLIMGPSGVGLLVPGHFKLGAIGGVTPEQIKKSALLTPGRVAVISTSGGMVGELIRSVADAGKRISFSACVGGDRFPVTSFTDLFLMAEADAATKSVVYFGELGGEDEYEIIELIKAKRFTKPLVAYIAGSVDAAFTERTQFGHAKALARGKNESALAKRAALREAGATAPDTFTEFLSNLANLSQDPFTDPEVALSAYEKRRPSILSTRTLTGEYGAEGGFVAKALYALLPKPPQSALLGEFVETAFGMLIDHGGNVSGAVTTMITARAGKDMVSSLASGLLTIGPRFGGAVSGAGATFHAGVVSGKSAVQFVESETRAGRLIAGIGHRKYRLGIPDPRVALISKYAEALKAHPHYDFARRVEKVTTAKNGSLILNVDGAVASLFLDILQEKEGYSNDEIDAIIKSELLNALFIIPRTVGFIGHFLAQKRNDEGLFRLPDDLLFEE